MLECATIDAQDINLHGLHLGPQSLGNIAVAAGAAVYPVPLKANISGHLVVASELFPNAAWKSSGRVIVPATASQRAVLGPVIKSELHGLAGNAWAFTADLQPIANVNTNEPTSDPVPFAVQLMVSNCAQACNVFVTLV